MTTDLPTETRSSDELPPLSVAVKNRAAAVTDITDTSVDHDEGEVEVSFTQEADREDVRRSLTALDVVGTNPAGQSVKLSFTPVLLYPNQLRCDADESFHFVANCAIVPAQR